jgi:hypothetical protein
MRLTIELMPHEEVVLLKNQDRFNFCSWEEADQQEEIVEYTFEDDNSEGLQEATEGRLLAQFKSAEDAELVLTMFNIIQRTMQETSLR